MAVETVEVRGPLLFGHNIGIYKAELRNPGRDISFQYLQKRNRNKKNYKGNQNNNIMFKPLLIFSFQYIAEKKLKQEYWKGNQNKNISFYRLNISFIQHNAGLRLVDFFHQWETRNILIYRDIMLIYRDL